MAEIVRLRPVRPCPICRKPSTQQFHPFCSARCANVDLNRWLTGSYVIPASTDSDPDEGEAPLDLETDDDI
ncbi:MAG: zinc-binding protein [Devosia sp.]|nr:zinc-binding protein [Devosia sp.]